MIAPAMNTRGEDSSEAVRGTFFHAHGDASKTFLRGINDEIKGECARRRMAIVLQCQTLRKTTVDLKFF